MDNKFHVDPKLWDTLDDDQKTEMNETLAQHKEFVKKEVDKDYQTKMEQVKEQTAKELTAKQEAEKQRQEALQTIPENKRDFAGKLLDKGFSLDEIKQDNPEWFKPEQPVADQKVFAQAVVEPHNGTTVPPSGKTDADLDAKIKVWKRDGMPENATDSDWEQWNEAHKKGLI